MLEHLVRRLGAAHSVRVVMRDRIRVVRSASVHEAGVIWSEAVPETAQGSLVPERAPWDQILALEVRGWDRGGSAASGALTGLLGGVVAGALVGLVMAGGDAKGEAGIAIPYMSAVVGGIGTVGGLVVGASRPTAGRYWVRVYQAPPDTTSADPDSGSATSR